ncbi:hypothetical protein Golob_017154 [Gossypium lobatum]|uniref:RNase H type-1 domain-containing protein n=1 Tax=Gossypium lobatum TaxID=34289 RepID=A0A7J8M6H8_9ROSI|nr:hypothetical protein [Gossypium lobatum]
MCGCLCFQISLNKGSSLPYFRIGFYLTFVFMKDCRIQLKWLRSLAAGLGNTMHILVDAHIVARDLGYAATGGMVRDHYGNWIVGFTRFLRVCSPFEAEVWSILDRIFILLNKGYRRAIILTDNVEVVQILTNLNLEDSRITVLRRTQRIMRAEGMWKVKHIPRNHNLVVDRLAKLSLSWKSSLQVLNEAPKEIIHLLQEDKEHGCFM